MNPQRIKIAIGMLLGVALGVLCRVFGLPSPAPPALAGAGLVVSMTLGYLGVGRWCTHREARNGHLCGGPDGSTVRTGP